MDGDPEDGPVQTCYLWARPERGGSRGHSRIHVFRSVQLGTPAHVDVRTSTDSAATEPEGRSLLVMAGVSAAHPDRPVRTRALKTTDTLGDFLRDGDDATTRTLARPPGRPGHITAGKL